MRKSWIPNLITLTNLSFGIFSIMATQNSNYFLSAIFIIVAAIIDRYDGRIARFLNVSTDLGKELDSLSDLISFGVAPSILIYVKYNLSDSLFYKLIGVCFLLLYILCGSFRLAKYNSTEFNNIFAGVPITITGCALAILSLLAPTYNNITVLIVTIIMVIFSYLMVSKIKIKKI